MRCSLWRCLRPPLRCFRTDAVSANDNKAVLVKAHRCGRKSGRRTVNIIDLSASPPKVIGEVKAPASVVGPPQSVAVSKDESYALVTGAFKVDPADPKKAVPNDALSVIDLKANPPNVNATCRPARARRVFRSTAPVRWRWSPTATKAPSRCSRSRATTLTPAGKIDFGNANSGPCHAAITPDGKMALVTRDGDHKISILSVDGNTVTDTKKFMVGGYRPYGIEISAKGDIAVVGNQGGDKATLTSLVSST